MQCTVVSVGYNCKISKTLQVNHVDITLRVEGVDEEMALLNKGKEYGVIFLDAVFARLGKMINTNTIKVSLPNGTGDLLGVIGYIYGVNEITNSGSPEYQVTLRIDRLDKLIGVYPGDVKEIYFHMDVDSYVYGEINVGKIHSVELSDEFTVKKLEGENNA